MVFLKNIESTWLDPSILKWDNTFLEDRQVVLSYPLTLKSFFREGDSFMSFPRGKKVKVKSVKEEDSFLKVYIKGLSFRESEEEIALITKEYPWVYSSSFIVSISREYDSILFNQKKVPISRFSWLYEDEEVISRLSYIGEDDRFSLWQVYHPYSLRVCLGSVFSFLSFSEREGKGLILSAVLSDFKSKRESLGIFLKAGQDLFSYYILRSSLGLFVCPSLHESFLPTDSIPLGNHYFIKKRDYITYEKKVFKLAQSFGGVSLESIKDNLLIDKDLLSILLNYWIEDKIIEEKEGFYWLKEGVQSRLSPLAKAVLKDIEERSVTGISLRDYKNNAQKQTVKTLYFIGLIGGYLPEEFFLSLEAINFLKEKLSGLSPNLGLSLSEIRDVLEISRKVAISFCETLGSQGLLYQDEEEIWYWHSS